MEAALPLVFTLTVMFAFAYGTGRIAARKGRNAVLWGVFGAFFGIVAVIVAAVMPAKQPAF